MKPSSAQSHRASTPSAVAWARVFLVVAIAHIGVAAATGLHLASRSTSHEDYGMENAIEIATFVTSAASDMQPDASDVEQVDQVATPKVNEVLSTKREIDLPTAPTSPRDADDPELRLAQERTQKENDENTEEQQTTEAMKAQEARQSSRTSIVSDSAPAQEGETLHNEAAAPDIGSTRDHEQRVHAWYRALFRHIGKHKVYPHDARSRKLQGEAIITFTLDRDGRMTEARIEKSSGSNLLDRAALEVMQRADPLPKPPAGLVADRRILRLPMRFQIK